MDLYCYFGRDQEILARREISKPLAIELNAVDRSDFIRLGGILRQIEYYCQAQVEVAGFDQPANHVVYMGMDVN